ncbi:MAG TPA: hypothetical protein VHR66_28025 [Gemmataceae bacterium]|jgi:hypothetical protein|nr:hypothetical protein [Gemmataceae bacterium]
MDVPTLIREIKALDPIDRGTVLGAIRELVESDRSFTPSQLTELSHRIAAFEAGTLATEPWEVVKARWQAGK